MDIKSTITALTSKLTAPPYVSQLEAQDQAQGQLHLQGIFNLEQLKALVAHLEKDLK